MNLLGELKMRQMKIPRTATKIAFLCASALVFLPCRAPAADLAILRNGWYLENHTSTLGHGVAQGILVGSSNDGRFSSASRADYAAAAVAALTQAMSGNRTYELAGDRSFSMAELAAEVSRQIGRAIPYRNLSRDEFAAVLRDFMHHGVVSAATLQQRINDTAP